MSRQSELFDRAADCERLMSLASDLEKRGILRQLRDLWITLANESDLMSARSLANEVAAMEKIQSSLIASKDKSIH